jgi:hypothetical protein
MREILAKLAERLTSSYRDAARERGALSQEWWDQGNPPDDVLLEAELYTDGIAGFASQVGSRRGPSDPADVMDQLAKLSLFSNPILTAFIIEREHEFPLFCRHLLWVEALRSACIVAASQLSEAWVGG